MRTIFTAFIILVFSVGCALGQTKYFYTIVASPTKTVDYLFGFYPSTAIYAEPASAKPYTAIKAVLINQPGANDFVSNDDKIMILLKSGKLIRNYTTQAKEGEFAVVYTTKPGEKHTQQYCFNGKVDVTDIDRVWYILGDNQIFELLTAETKPASE